ncbi:MAG: transcriptional regulator, LysR family [Alphaproteobacteria bacterium]|nr:transcriptional regulator, LysR family [Alphaproteobacteria bacterium]
MRFKGLDLNLLVAFDLLLEERSVSRAAERLNLSQPAMSSALGRLRDYFRDDILVSHGKRMFPTAYAESLVPQIRESLRGLESLIATSQSFDPATSHRNFRITGSDYITAALLVPLVTRLAEISPNIRLDISLPTDNSGQQLDEGKIDLLLTPEMFISGDHPADLLFEERHVVAGWSGNALLEGPVTEQAFFESGHVAVALGNQRVLSFGDRQIELLGGTRHIEVTAASFTMVPWLLQNTHRLAVMHERLALAMARHLPIRHADLPFELPPMREMAQFHTARRHDAGLKWFREELKAAASASPISTLDADPSK